MVRRLSVAVMVNGKTVQDGEGNPTYEPRTAEELEKISSSEKRIAELENIEKRYLTKIGKLGEALSARRQEAAGRLAEAVERELRDLGMPGARFSVDFQREPDENGVSTIGPAGSPMMAVTQVGDYALASPAGNAPTLAPAKAASGPQNRVVPSSEPSVRHSSIPVSGAYAAK
mgnify:CR=1 FL=1